MFRLSPHVYLLVVTLCSSTLQAGPVGIAGAVGNPAVVIDIVPNNPGPYFGGEQLTFDIWFRSQIVHSVSMKFLQLDFTDTDTNILLDPVFTFDFTSVMVGDHYVVNDSLPIPNAFNNLLGGENTFLNLEAGGSLHVGVIGGTLPTTPGIFRLDLLNKDSMDPSSGARITTLLTFKNFFQWEASDGDIGGGMLDVTVVPEPTTLSLLAIGCFFLRRKKC